mmetsp:Transcript_17634/g.71256  ORF Transcript_17634/g.71256 Transcript_17634/m.71256 type:complete len:106 (-) Transcript_17634:48-365(-)
MPSEESLCPKPFGYRTAPSNRPSKKERKFPTLYGSDKISGSTKWLPPEEKRTLVKLFLDRSLSVVDLKAQQLNTTCSFRFISSSGALEAHRKPLRSAKVFYRPSD